MNPACMPAVPFRCGTMAKIIVNIGLSILDTLGHFSPLFLNLKHLNLFLEKFVAPQSCLGKLSSTQCVERDFH